MKLLITNRLRLTENIYGQILNGIWQISGYDTSVNRKQAIQALFDYTNANYLIYQFHRQLIVQYHKYTLAYLQVFTKWLSRLTKIAQQLLKKSINISVKKVNVDSLYLLICYGWEYQDNRYCLP